MIRSWELECLFILLTSACFCHIVSTQSDGDPYSGLGYLKPLVEERIHQCGQIWVEGCLMKLTRQPTGQCSCEPTFEHSAEVFQTTRIGGNVTLFCIFSGYPLPTILWRGPRNSLPAGRHRLTNWDTTLILNGITAPDEGNYSCLASNIYGENARTLQIRVVAVPEFRSRFDGPYNVSVTEGESVTFNCSPFGVPGANIVWLLNRQPIKAHDPPGRFMFSSDWKRLTIRDVCRDCDDQERPTDLMVIQCNASNVHGYAFVSGYLNVLMKTKVTIRGPENVSVDFLEEKQLVFQCHVTSDPSTPPTVHWYKTQPFCDLVRDEPPYVNVTNEFLIITIDPKCPAECVKYLGEYRCVGDNKYSLDNQTITLHYVARPPPDIVGEKEETWAAWKIILAAGTLGLGLLLIGIFLRSRWKQSSSDVNREMKNRRLPNLPSIYEDVGYDSIGFPLGESTENTEGSATIAYSMYEHIGYDSIDQVQEEIALREQALDPSSGVHGYNKYESIDAPQRQAIGKGRPRPPLPDEEITCHDRGYPLPLEDVTNGGYIDRHQAYCSESFTNEDEHFPTSNSQSEASTTFSDFNRKELNPKLRLENSESNPKEDKPYLDLVISKANSHLDIVSTEVNPYLDLVSTEGNPYLDLVSTEGNPRLEKVLTAVNLDLASKEVNPYLDLVSTEVNPCLDKVSTEVNLYLDLVSSEVNQYLDLDSDPEEVNQHSDLDPGPKDLKKDPREVNQYTELGLKEDPREVNQYTELGLKEVNKSRDLAHKKSNQNTKLGLKEVNQYMGLGSRELNLYMDLGPRK